ncbi:MAG TPA: phosphatase PAP2 family protein [Syntrophales bacterium]|nr:phosphatase PAP2 family protein [Syntrophales bacterium]
MGTTDVKLCVSFAAVILFSIAGYYWIDLPVAVFCKGMDPWVSNVFDWISTWGESTWYLVAAFGLFLYFRKFEPRPLHANRALFVFASVAVSGLVTLLVKAIFGRFRPILYFTEGLYGFNFFHPSEDMNSFPSGHAATALSLAFALSRLFPKYRIPLFFIGLTIALSRMVTTAHFLSDTVAGAWIGVATVCLLHRALVQRDKAQSCGLKS